MKQRIFCSLTTEPIQPRRAADCQPLALLPRPKSILTAETNRRYSGPHVTSGEPRPPGDHTDHQGHHQHLAARWPTPPDRAGQAPVTVARFVDEADQAVGGHWTVSAVGAAGCGRNR